VSEKAEKGHTLWPLIIGLLIALIGFFVNQRLIQPLLQQNNNKLLLGTYSPIAGSIEIKLNPTKEYDGLSRSQVLSSRREVVAQEPKLYAKPYEPSHRVFGQIEDGKPWWGIQGVIVCLDNFTVPWSPLLVVTTFGHHF